MKFLPFFAFYQTRACSDKFVNCASLVDSCNNSDYIRDTCQITCNSCEEKRQLSQYQIRQVEKPIRASKRKYARQLAKKYGINIMGQEYCADIFSICPKYKFMCSYADSQYAQNCKKTCGLCNRNIKAKPTQKSRTTPRKNKTKKPITTKPRRTKRPKRTTTRTPKQTNAQKPVATTMATWVTAAPYPFTQRYQFSLTQYQLTPHYTQNAAPVFTNPSYPNYVFQTASVQPACVDRAQNCANTVRYCHSAPGSPLAEQIRKYCQKTCGMCPAPTTPQATLTTRRTTTTTPPQRPKMTSKPERTTHSRPKKTRLTTTKPRKTNPERQTLPKPVPTVNIANLLSRIPTIKTTTRKLDTTPKIMIGEQKEKCQDKWSSCDLMLHRCNQSIIKSNCFKTCSSNCQAILLSTAAPATSTFVGATTEAETTTELLETTTTDAWTMTTASTTTIFDMSEINEECEDILPTCASNRENCFHEENELFLKVCRKTCGVCGVKDTFLIMAKQELSSMIVFKYQLESNFEHIDIVNEMATDLTGVCSVLWKDRPLFLGAGVNKNEVISFGRDSCSFKKEQKLRNEFSNGICYSNNQKVFFCSPSSRENLKSCWRFDDLNEIEDIPNHNHYHLRGSITEYKNRLTLVAGNGEPKIEALEYPLWIELPSIPESKALYDLSTLVVDGRLLTFGGNRGEGGINKVWIFNGDMWFGGPKLKSARISPAVIEQGGKIIILGGCVADSCQTETMEQVKGKMVFDKEELPRDLGGFGTFGNHVFLVDNRYCS